MSQQLVTLLLGSNLGDQKKNLENAIVEIENKIGNVISQSNFLYSNPVEFASFNIFCNIAILIGTHLSPVEVLNTIKSIEKSMGRECDSAFYGEYKDRIIDIDIVTYNNVNFESKKLSIPHKKHIEEREFSQSVLNNLKRSEKHRL